MRALLPGLMLAVVVGVVPTPRGADGRAAVSASAATDGPEADALNRHWRRLPSRHFTAVGDAPESVLRDALTELEVFRAALSGLAGVLPAPRFRDTTPLIVVFRDESSFGPYKPKDLDGRRRNNVGGYYFDDPQGAYIVTAAAGRHWGPRSGVVLHEYAHEVFHVTLGPGVPPWLDEGLAELCSSVGTDADSQTSGRRLGRPIAGHLAALRRTSGLGVAELLSVDHVALVQMAPDDAARFYARSWALVHYLLLGREGGGPGDVPAFLAALNRGRSPVEAFASAFRLDVAEAEAAVANHVLRPALPTVAVATPPSAGAEAAADRMFEWEVEQIQGNLLLQVRDLEGAGRHLGRAFARNPGSAAIRLSLARFQIADLEPEAALELLSPLAADRPAAYVPQLVIGRARQRAGRFAAALDAFGTATTLATPGLEAWYGLSLSAALFDDGDTAAEAMSRLQAIDPAPAWYFERARDLWEAGRDDLVVADIQTLLTAEVADVNGRAYGAFIGALSARRLARAAVADDMLAQVGSTALAPWPQSVLAFLQGRLTPREFLARTRGAGQQTEAHAYIGITESIAGRSEEARRHLTWVRDRGVRAYAEYDMSRLELARLAAGTGTPAE